MRTHIKSAIQKLLLLTGSLMLSAFVMEGMVLVLMGEQPKVPRHVVGGPFGLRINDPNVTYRHKTADVTVTFHINGQGMRAGRDYSYMKTPGVKRIVIMGDSFTMGHEVNVDDTYSRVLEESLRKNGVSVEVLNTGVSGYGTAEECLYLERELFKYSPDLVIVGFFGNDLVDNVRSNLFALKRNELVQIGQEYVPLGRFGDFLNRNPVLNVLSERSNALAFTKERITELLKRRAIDDNLRNLDEAVGRNADLNEQARYQRKLTAAIFERIYADTRRARIPLIIQSIPSLGDNPESLIEVFPLGEFDVNRDGLYFLAGTDFLAPVFGREALYWQRSDGHWTPLSHHRSGEALAGLILQDHVLQ